MPPTVLPTSSVKTLRTVLTLSSRSLCSDTDIEECVTVSEEKRQSQPPTKKRKISLFPESDEDCGLMLLILSLLLSLKLQHLCGLQFVKKLKLGYIVIRLKEWQKLVSLKLQSKTLALFFYFGGGKAGSLIWPSGLAWSLPFPQAVLGLNVCGIMPS